MSRYMFICCRISCWSDQEMHIYSVIVGGHSIDIQTDTFVSLCVFCVCFVWVHCQRGWVCLLPSVGMSVCISPRMYINVCESDTKCILLLPCLSVCLSACLSVCLSVHLSNCLSLCVYVCVSVCMLVCRWMSLWDSLHLSVPLAIQAIYKINFLPLSLRYS